MKVFKELKKLNYKGKKEKETLTERKKYQSEFASLFSEVAFEQIAKNDTLFNWFNKSDNVRGCGGRVFVDSEDKIEAAYFCKDSLCPMCNWRRSAKLQSQNIKIMSELFKNNKGMKQEYLFITWTVRNAKTSEELRSSYKEMSTAFNRMNGRKVFKENSLGFIKAVETTVNSQRGTEWFGSYNQHMHDLRAFKKGFLSNFGKNKEEQEEALSAYFSETWKQSAKLDYTPMVKVEVVKAKNMQSLMNAVLEVSKYSVKGDDILNSKFSRKEKLKIVLDLERAMKGHRKISYGGIFASIRKELGLTDVEKMDLADDPEEKKESDVIRQIDWSYSIKRYEVVSRLSRAEFNSMRDGYASSRPGGWQEYLSSNRQRIPGEKFDKKEAWQEARSIWLMTDEEKMEKLKYHQNEADKGLRQSSKVLAYFYNEFCKFSNKNAIG